MTVTSERVDDTVGPLLRLALDDGHAERMGDGQFVVFQTIGERTFSVTLSIEDMQKMLAMD